MIKKKSFSKMIAFITVSVLCITGLVSYANSTLNEGKMQEFRTKYNMKSVTKKDLPEGVKALEFNSIEEAEKWIEEFKNSSKGSLSDAPNASSEIAPMTAGSKSTYWNVGIFSSGITKLNMKVYYNYLYDFTKKYNYYDSCTNVTSYISGLTAGIIWTQTGYYSNIGKGLGSASYLSVNLDGTWTVYIFIQGIGNVYTEPGSYSATWYGNP